MIATKGEGATTLFIETALRKAVEWKSYNESFLVRWILVKENDLNNAP
jgi:hypothetical protein